ncbi:MAG TPA: nucleoside 2-deoxyribosyltransferase [Patescibacteria group bacterium]|nr:nucleoside 2-deoxyribosyltransferase [Patescibacteria group bacterium]
MKIDKLSTKFFIFGNLEIPVPAKKLVPGIKLYIAGPLGFAEATRPFHQSIIKLVRIMGGEPIDAWALTPKEETDRVNKMSPGRRQEKAYKKVNEKIFKKSIRALDEVMGVIAVLDGPDVDSGTAAEIGYAAGRLIPIIGYRGDFRIASDNIGTPVNLMIAGFIHNSGGLIIRHISDLPNALLAIWGNNANSAQTVGKAR